MLKRIVLLTALIIGCAEDVPEPVAAEDQLGPALVSSSVDEDGTLLLTFSKPVAKVTVDGRAATLTDDARRAHADVGDGKLDVAWTGRGAGAFLETLEFAVPGDTPSDTVGGAEDDPADTRPAFGSLLATLRGHSDRVRSVSFSPDGTTLATGGWRDPVKIWNVAARDEAAALRADVESAECVAFSPDGTMLAIGGVTLRGVVVDGMMELWNVAERQKIASLPVFPDGVQAVAFSPDGATLALGTSSKVILWNVAERQTDETLAADHWAYGLAFSPDGATLAGGIGDSTVQLWDMATRQKIASLHGHTQRVRSVAFSPNGETLASGGQWNVPMKLWDVVTQQSITALQGHSDDVESVAYSVDGTMLASGGQDNTARIWDLASRREIATLTGHRDEVQSVAFSPDGTTLASGGGDNTVKLWYVGR